MIFPLKRDYFISHNSYAFCGRTMPNETSLSQPSPSSVRKRARTAWDKRIYMLLIGLVLAAGAKVLVGVFYQAPMPPSEFPEIGGDFTLQSAGGPVSLHDFSGKITVAYFGYTHCPDICSATLSNVAAAFRLLKGMDGLAQTQGVFITLDPQADRVAEVDNYARYFHAQITGLTGTDEQIGKVADRYKVGYQIDAQSRSQDSYTISHSGYIYIIRPDGRMGALLSHTTPPRDIAEAVRTWLPWAD